MTEALMDGQDRHRKELIVITESEDLMFRVLIAALVACMFMSAPSKALAQDPVMDVVKTMKEVFEPVRPSTRQVEITMTAGGETNHWVARQAMKQFPDGKRMVMVMVEPNDVKGNAYIIWEPKDKPSAIWTYLPFLRRVHELLGVDAYEHFLGTDFGSVANFLDHTK